VIYAAFAGWLILIIFVGVGLYRLWTHLGRAVWINWILLPGTVVSEMAYIFGCLITGGEIRRAKLVPGAGNGSGGGEGEPTTEAEPKLKLIGPMVASMLAIAACAAGILVCDAYLGEPVIQHFAPGEPSLVAALPQELPGSWEGLWSQLNQHLRLVKRICETWVELDWLNWRVPLFVYLAGCLAIRLAPVGRPLRPTLLAVVVLAAGVALMGLIMNDRFAMIMRSLWPLLTYVWAWLLFLLFATLAILGLVRLIKALVGEK